MVETDSTWPGNWKLVNMRYKEMGKCKCEKNNPNKCDCIPFYTVDMLTNTNAHLKVMS